MLSRTTRIDTVLVGGFQTVVATRKQLADLMVEDCTEPKPRATKLVFSSNGQGIALAGWNNDFANLMGEADLIHADGMSVVLASRLTATPIPERCSTTDFFHDAAEAASDAGLSFFFLGGREKQNAAAVDRTRNLYPDLRIAGRHHGYFEASENETVCRKIRDSGADILWVAMGKPHQERWSVENREHLWGVAWIKTCGGLYGFLAGESRRAPLWMQNAGLEWLFRMFQEPRRLPWRYLVTNPYALYRLIRFTHR